MSELDDIRAELVVTCGVGSARQLADLFTATPDLRVWQMVAKAVRRANPTSPMAYLRQALRTATDEMAYLDGHPVGATTGDRFAGWAEAMTVQKCDAVLEGGHVCGAFRSAAWDEREHKNQWYCPTCTVMGFWERFGATFERREAAKAATAQRQPYGGAK